jgi:hypothetical protein
MISLAQNLQIKAFSAIFWHIIFMIKTNLFLINLANLLHCLAKINLKFIVLDIKNK